MTVSEIRQLFTEQAQAVTNSNEVDALKERFFNRKTGLMSNLLRSLASASNAAEKKQLGEEANTLKQELHTKLEQLALQYNPTSEVDSQFDPSLPATTLPIGHVHPLRQVQRELVDIFYSMGFMVAEGNELENELYCFEYLNIPPTHPARDLQDTFYVATTDPVKLVLRTQTSNMQVRLMQQHQPPFRAVVPGRVFRNEAMDASHEHTFYQMEGVVVDKDISIANLTYVLKTAMSKLLAQDVKIRLRPGYFPYVEPGFEADCSCTQCNGKGCAVCKYTGWVEMLGCGMVHPKVFESAGYPANTYSGFAFGIGINRLAMMKYGINDIRLFMGSDMRFLEQF